MEPQAAYLFCFITGATLLLGDSIPKYVPETQGLHNECIRGATVARLTDHIFFKNDPQSFENIIVHIGTNDIVPGKTASMVVKEYKILLEIIKEKYPLSSIFVSAILPRPRDALRTHFITCLINELLCILADRLGLIFMPSYKLFVKSGSTILGLFGSDKLHLRASGTFLLAKFFRQQIIPHYHAKRRLWTSKRAAKLTKKITKRGYPSLKV